MLAFAGCAGGDEAAGGTPAGAPTSVIGEYETEVDSSREPEQLISEEKGGLGIVVDANDDSFSDSDAILKFCQANGLNFEEYTTAMTVFADADSAYDTAEDLIRDYDCTTVAFAIEGMVDVAEVLANQYPDIHIVLAVSEESSESVESSQVKESEVDIEWTEVVYTTTDSDGYIYEITFNLSPWILLSNTEFVEAAWAEVGAGNTLPGFDDWGLDQSNDHFRQGIPMGGLTNHFYASMNDMYYCIGSFQIENITDGWRISSENPRSTYVKMSWISSYDRDSVYGGAYAIGRTFYSNGFEDESDGVNTNAKLSKDSWGPVPFIIMAPENFSPKFPSGEYAEHMLSGYFNFAWSNGTQVSLGVVGQDGIYTTPIA